MTHSYVPFRFSAARLISIEHCDRIATEFVAGLTSPDGALLRLAGPAIAFVMLERACIAAAGDGLYPAAEDELGETPPTRGLRADRIESVRPSAADGWVMRLGVSCPNGERRTLILTAPSSLISELGSAVEDTQQRHWMP